jgi:hypothetical protein
MSSESGRFEIYVDSFPNLEKQSGSRWMANGSQWRQDARELFFLSADYKLIAVEAKFDADSVEISALRELFAVPFAENLHVAIRIRAGRPGFLVRTATEQSQPLTLIVNWPSLMKGSGGR